MSENHALNSNIIPPMDFSDALYLLKQGKQMARFGWGGKGMYIEIQRPDAHSKMSLPYIFIKTVGDNMVPWLASQTDLLAEDWEEVRWP